MCRPDSGEIELIKRLQGLGVISPLRARRLVRQAIESLKLDLRGLIVLTEAASRNYVYTPIIAAMARARIVYALTRDSNYGSMREVTEATNLFAQLCNVSERIEVVTEKTADVVGHSDIVTNLGFVRPIDMATVAMMKSTAVIPLMCEAWEFRPGDVDLSACRSKGVMVLGTNENYPALQVFDFSGNVCLKMLFGTGIEVYKSKIAIISGDKFGIVIEKYVKAAGGEAGRFENLKSNKCKEFLQDADAVVIADYCSSELFIGNNGQMDVDELLELSPTISVVQFSGIVEVQELDRVGIPYFPKGKVGAIKMGMTLADLGPKPIIDLHTAGLKVGELASRARESKLDVESVEDAVVTKGPWAGLAQKLSFH